MRLLIVGSDKVYAIENFYFQHIKNSGIPVRQFAAQSYFYDYYQASLKNKLWFKLGFSSILKKINHSLKALVEEFNPSAMLIFKGMEVFPDTIQWAKRKGIRMINYNPDNPFLFSNKGSGNRHVTESLGLYDLHLTYNLSIKKQLEEKFSIKTEWLPFGYEISESAFETAKKEPEIVKACFLGNPDKERAHFIQQLLEGGIEIDLYGNSWERFISHPGAQSFAAVYADDYWKTLRKYRVQLNLMRIHNPVSHNMRSFEIPAVGGIALMPVTPEHTLFFKEGEEAFFFHEVSDCIQTIHKLLAMDLNSSMAIRERARARSEASGYSYKNRAAAAIGFIQALYD